MKIALTTTFLIFLVVAACMATSGTMSRYTKRTTITDSETVREVVVERTEVELPESPKAESMFNIDDGKGVAATMPPVYQPPKRDTVMEGHAIRSFYLAALCGLLAALSLVGKKWFPMIPSYAPIGFGVGAFVFYVFPIVLDRYPWQCGMVALALVAWCVYGYRHNRKLENLPSPQEEQVTDVQ